MSWLEPLHRRFYGDRGVDAVKSTLRRLTGHPPRYRYLQPELLDGKRKYVRLTSAAARTLGFADSVARPLGRNSLIGRYGLQWFIEVDGAGKRWHCRRRDLQELFGGKLRGGTRRKVYVESDERGSLIGFAVVDLGGDARRMVRSMADALERHLEEAWLDDLVAENRFEVTFLTVTEGKAASLAEGFNRAVEQRLGSQLRNISNSASIPARTIVVPGLVDLVPTRGR